MGEIKIREDFRRDGLAANFLANGELISYVANAFPGSKINIGYPSICFEEFKACKEILDFNHDCESELCVVGHARQDHVLELDQILRGYDNVSANVWIPISDYFIERTVRRSPDEVLRSAVKLIRLWNSKNSSTPFDIALADCTAKEGGLNYRIRNWCEALLDAGARTIIVCDTKGVATPEEIELIFSSLNNVDYTRIEFHPHNDNGQALKNIEVGIQHGIQTIGTAIYEAGERRTMVDPRNLTSSGLVFNELSFRKFERKYRELIGNPDELIKKVYGSDVITTGTQYRLQDRVEGKKLLFGATTDQFILSKMLEIPQECVDRALLDKLKNEFLYQQKRIALSKLELIHAMKEKSYGLSNQNRAVR